MNARFLPGIWPGLQQSKGQDTGSQYGRCAIRYLGRVGLVLAVGCQPQPLHDTHQTTVASSQPMALLPGALPVATLKDAVDTYLTHQLKNTASPTLNQHPLTDTRVSVAGLGPIQLGMTITEAREAAEVGFAVAPGHQAQVCQYYFPTDDRNRPIGGIGIMAIEERIIRIDIWPGSSIQTLSGAGIGSTETELDTLYPGAIDAQPHAYTQGKYLTYIANTDGRNLYRIVFETSPEGNVTQYRTGQFPAVTWKDGCS